MKYYIETYGCQMNVYDSRQMELLLQGDGHEPVQQPGEAELLLVNTCAIRESAEQRVWGQLGHYKRLKEKGPCRILGLCGCMAQNHAEGILRRAPHVDLVLGPGALHMLPQLIRRQLAQGSPQMDLAFYEEDFLDSSIARQARPSARRDSVDPVYPVYVAVMRGCDYHCTYCVVPRVRGGEVCRPPERICDEVRTLVGAGYREVTLVGQTVNSYRSDSVDFAQLLRSVARIPGLDRVRFATSHPRSFSSELIDALAEEEKLCEHVHLPVQSGSDRILRRMARRYTAGEYRRLCAELRRRVEGVSITTDLIFGFPGETEEDFQQTLDLMREVRWEGGFLFKYSPRPQVAADRLPDPVPKEVVSRRFQQALDLQMQIAAEANRPLEGTTVEILLEEIPKRTDSGLLHGSYKGRTRANKMVVVHPEDDDGASRLRVGDLIAVRITEARAYTLYGQMAEKAAVAG